VPTTVATAHNGFSARRAAGRLPGIRGEVIDGDVADYHHNGVARDRVLAGPAPQVGFLLLAGASAGAAVE